MATIRTPNLDSHELAMMQLSDSFFPSGMFGMSGGLESMAKANWIKDKKAVSEFLHQQILFQIVPCDCMAFSIAIDAARKGDLRLAVKVDHAYLAMKLVSEVRLASVRSGRQLLKSVLQVSRIKFASQFNEKIDAGKAEGSYPVCMAIAATAFDIPKTSALRIVLYTYCTSITAAAVRLGLLDHIEAQTVLKEMHQLINSEAIRASDPKFSKNADPLSILWQLSSLVDIAQMLHERDELRMFIT